MWNVCLIVVPTPLPLSLFPSLSPIFFRLSTPPFPLPYSDPFSSHLPCPGYTCIYMISSSLHLFFSFSVLIPSLSFVFFLSLYLSPPLPPSLDLCHSPPPFHHHMIWLLAFFFSFPLSPPHGCTPSSI